MFERFIARRFMPRHGAEGNFSGLLVTVATVGIGLGVLVMIMAVGILRGFQANIRNKVAGFGGHLTVHPYEAGTAYVESGMTYDRTLAEQLRHTEGVAHVQSYATKGGMVKTADQIYGILLRGYSPDSDTGFFASCLVEGYLPRAEQSNEVMVSSTIARKLRLGVGDKLRTYFWQEKSYRSRAFEVCGIYNTDLAEMDEVYVVGSLAQVQRLNGWADDVVGGIELTVEDFGQLEPTAQRVAEQLPYALRVESIVERSPALFSWLDLLDANIALILAIMCLVCAVAIVSALLIMIFEKSSTIGLLKALGATGRSIGRIFVMKAMGIVLTGIAIGEATAWVLSAVQNRWQVVSLDPESYSMAYVQVAMDGWIYVLIGLGTALLCLAALLPAVGTVGRISPARTMRTQGT